MAVVSFLSLTPPRPPSPLFEGCAYSLRPFRQVCGWLVSSFYYPCTAGLLCWSGSFLPAPGLRELKSPFLTTAKRIPFSLNSFLVERTAPSLSPRLGRCRTSDRGNSTVMSFFVRRSEARGLKAHSWMLCHASIGERRRLIREWL